MRCLSVFENKAGRGSASAQLYTFSPFHLHGRFLQPRTTTLNAFIVAWHCCPLLSLLVSGPLYSPRAIFLFLFLIKPPS